MMTSRERLLCALRGPTPDRVPVAPFGMVYIDFGSELGQELIDGTDILYSVRDSLGHLHRARRPQLHRPGRVSGPGGGISTPQVC